MAEKTSAHSSVELEELARQRFTPEDKAERVRKGLAALNEKPSIKLSPADWKWVAEELEFEDQF